MRSVLKKIYWSLIDTSYSDDEKQIMEYVFISVSFEIIKGILIFIILSMTNYFKEGLIICLVMFTSKPFIGGYHEESQIKCFISTLISIGIIFVIANNCEFTLVGNGIALLLSVFCIWNQAPIINSKMPLTKLNLINRNRIYGTVIISIFAITSIIIYKSQYYIFITWSVIFQALMMFEKNLKITIDKL